MWRGWIRTATVNFSNSQQGLENTTETFSSKHTGGNGEHVHVEALGITLQPDVIEDRASSHGNRVEGLRNDESETDGIPVGNVMPVFLGDPKVLQSVDVNVRTLIRDGE